MQLQDLAQQLGPTLYMTSLLREEMKQNRERIIILDVKLKCHTMPSPFCDLPCRKIYRFQWEVRVPSSRLKDVSEHPMVSSCSVLDIINLYDTQVISKDTVTLRKKELQKSKSTFALRPKIIERITGSFLGGHKTTPR